eukprot:847128-Pyramimonas_sp.AAC.1
MAAKCLEFEGPKGCEDTIRSAGWRVKCRLVDRPMRARSEVSSWRLASGCVAIGVRSRCLRLARNLAGWL